MKWLVLSVLCLGVLAGCTGAPASGGPAGVTCEVNYRASVAVTPQAKQTLELTSGQRTQAQASFDDLTLEATYMVPVAEVPALSVRVSSHDGKPVASALYQFDQKGVSNQFVGGHGFTGLNYVYAPDSEAELQYYCWVP